MSRPCFALSVMLGSLAACLLAIDQSYATDEVISPNHDSLEAAVCPSAHGVPAPCDDLLCAEYSDYDYNDYGDEAPAPPVEDVASDADNEAPPYDYDWYAEEFGSVEGEPSAELAENAADEGKAIEDKVADSTPTAGSSDAEDDAYSAYYDDYDWYAEEHGEAEEVASTPNEDSEGAIEDANADAMEEDFSAGGEAYEALMEAEVAEATGDDGDDFEYESGYETYEDMMQADRSEAAVEPGDDYDFEGYESYDSFMDAERSALDELDDATATDDPADTAADASVEDTWDSGDYGYYDDYEQYIEEYEFDRPNVDVPEAEMDESDESVETGYDEAYDEAMAAEAEEVEPTETPVTDVNSEIDDDYESFYNAYDDLYNYEDEHCEYRETPGPVIAEFEAGSANSADDLAEQVVEAVVEEISNPGDAQYGCEWDCEAEYWNETDAVNARADSTALILDAAQRLDNVAVAIEGVASFLRDVANGERTLLGKTADPTVVR